jgi:hypothetical protein
MPAAAEGFFADDRDIVARRKQRPQFGRGPWSSNQIIVIEAAFAALVADQFDANQRRVVVEYAEFS